MRCKVFAVVLHRPNEEVKRRILDEYPGSYEYNDGFFLLRAPETALSPQIAEAIGFRGDKQVTDASGFVIQLRSAYSGYTKRDLWEWLADVEESSLQ